MAKGMHPSGDQFDRSNEGKCCDAIVRLLERRTGCTRNPNNIRVNQKAGDSPQNVEVRLTLGNQDYAIEHTRIMGFPDTAKHRYFVEIRESVKAESLGVPGIYILYLCNIPENIHKNESRLKALTMWAHQTAIELNELSRSVTKKGQRIEKLGTPWGDQFELKLVRQPWSSEIVGMLDVRQYSPQGEVDDLEKKIGRALEDKCPKLKSHKDTGAISILILEILGSNISHHPICEALPDALNQRTDLPDEIFIVDSLTSKWFVIPFKQGQEYPEFPGRRAKTFDPCELQDMISKQTRRRRNE